MSLRYRNILDGMSNRYDQAGSISIFPFSCTFLRKPMRLSHDISRTFSRNQTNSVKVGKRQPCLLSQMVSTPGDECNEVWYATRLIYQRLRLIFSYLNSASLLTNSLPMCDRPCIYKDTASGNLSSGFRFGHSNDRNNSHHITPHLR